MKLNPGGVFDADVADAAGAKKGPRPEPGPEGEAPPRQKRQKKAAEPQPEVTDLHIGKARNLIRNAEALHRRGLRLRYEKLLSRESADELDELMKLSEAEIDLMALPLAEGMAIHGLSLPWWVELGLGAASFSIVRAQTCAKLEEEYKKRQAATEAAKP